MSSSAVVSVGVIGMGLQGHRLAGAVLAEEASDLVAVSCGPGSHEALDSRFGALRATTTEILESNAIDAVVVATPPDSHAVLVSEALGRGKDVLCEKPLGMTSAEASGMAACADASGRLLWCGFNHRHHPAIRRVLEEAEPRQVIGVRISYGIAGTAHRPTGWRWDPSRVGGGHLMEQGIHAVDLALLLMPGAAELTASLQAPLWQVEGLEEDASVLMRTVGGATASIHSSTLQWINLFRLEVASVDRYWRVDGLGPAYGEQTLTVVDRPMGRAPFREEVVHYRGGDVSFAEQWQAFLNARSRGVVGEPLHGAHRIEVVEAAYRGAAGARWIRIPAESREVRFR